VRTVYWAWSMILFAAIIVQIGLAGFGAFYAAHKLEDEGSTIDEDVFMDGFGLHAGWGTRDPARARLHGHRDVAGIGRWRLGRHGSCSPPLPPLWLAWIGFAVRFRGFLHPINAFLITALCGWIVWDEWQLWRARRRPRQHLSCVATQARCGARRRRETAGHAGVGDVHREPGRGVAEVVAVLHPDPGVLCPERDHVALAGQHVQGCPPTMGSGCRLVHRG